MKLYPYPDADWSNAWATQDGKCALSGKPIKRGAAIYATAEPHLASYQVLISEYANFIAMHHERMRAVT